ncbi:MAG: glycerol-3-phosphate dehydrogenase [Alphaproteobacteria bacterium]|nr:glycerol-3-phosphate dehydrogenase [Alphaproteobacteria bacterium]
MKQDILDIFIIGGGINGVGIARDAAGRGLNVMLVEQADLASATSSASSKLIHGGLRYLEYYQFALVRKALIEREILLNSAPHIIWPARFVIPHNQHQRPKWLVRLGLFLYDSLNLKQKLKFSRSVNLTKEAYGDAIKTEYTAGFVYSDCRVHDSRLVVLNAQDAANNGASINTHTSFISAKRDGKLWQITYKKNDQTHQVQAKVLINAAGPWVDGINQKKLKLKVKGGTRLITGSHIIVPKIYEGEHCYLFQNEDNRIVFAIPYENDFTMIGTTDKAFDGDNAHKVKISKQETEYLCEIANQYFEQQITPKDVKWSFSGVRSLFDDHAKDAKSVTRDYILDIERDAANPDSPPLLTVYGGKITTFRHLGQAACHKLRIFLPHMGLDWTRDATLPGGDINDSRNMAEFITTLENKYDFLPQSLIKRLATHYGSKVHQMLSNAQNIKALGAHMGYDIYAVELDYVMAHEWVTCADDFIWRRTRLGLHIDKKVITKIENYIKERMNAQN